MAAYILDVLFRYAHIVFGVTWIGLLYYFNFVQTEYIKEAEDAGKADVMAKLAPRALWWFRWAAMFTFLTGLVLLWWVSSQQRYNLGISLGALMGTLMMLNVWLIIWPNQKVMIGLAEGDKAVAGPKAGLASRTNTLFSLPMLYFMVASIHGLAASGGTWGAETSMPALIIGLVIIAVIEANAIWGKMLGVIQSVNAVIVSSIILTVIMAGLVNYI
ncbi:MAG: urate hydroxylase PuuD [Pseudomonadota bacterium]|nr:urate hydroxylase PuuD [Pseudomonadota bacterium]